MRKTKLAMLQSVVALILCAAMLVGTTFAWFTDEVTSAVNKIQAGTLDVDLVDAAGNSLEGTSLTFMDVTGNTDILWEPGCTFKTQGFRVANRGSLALEYTMYINGLLGDSKLLEVIRFSVQDADGYTVDIDTFEGQLSARASSDVFYLVGHMDENAGNEYMNLTLTGIGITVYATQAMEENDSFGPEYDKDAFFPGLDAPILGSVNITTENDLLTADAYIDVEGAKVTIPAGTRVKPGTTTLKLRVKLMDETTSDVKLSDNQVLQPMDVTVEGVSDDNQVPLTVELYEIAPVGLNMGSIALHHVHKGVTAPMTRVAADAAFTADNQYRYDPATGDLALHMATFSEVAVVADTVNPWEGKLDYTWYDASKTDLTIANADQLAALGAIVGGMAKDESGNFLITYKDSDGDEHHNDSFAGKTIKLIADINLGDDEKNNVEGKIFYPIGYWNNEGTYERKPLEERTTAVESGFYTFEGTFDGNGHTVSNFYQNTWEMKGDHNWYDPIKEQYYRDGMGLFGRVYGGTVKNLTIKNFSSDGEITTTGCVAAYADGATFENIAIFNCNPRVYNIGNGGIVGCVGWYAKEAGLKTTFKNITVDNSNKISALWGSYDVACGGIVGQYYPTSGQSSANYPVNAGLHFENCHVSAVMDVYNDVCANYQYYAYRYTGMLIGSVRENETIDGHVYPKMDKITASGCTVHYDSWNDYYYCELVANSLASYTHDHQMSRLEQVAKVEGTTITPLKGKTFTVPSTGRYNYVVVTGEHGTENATCYHFVDGKAWNHADAGKETVSGVEVLKEDKQHIYLPFAQLFTGYGWGVTSKGLEAFEGIGVTHRDSTDLIEKFEKNEALSGNFLYRVGNGNAFPIGKLFQAIDENLIVDSGVHVSVRSLVDGVTMVGTFKNNKDDWTQSTLHITGGTGPVELTIQDYNNCKECKLIVEVVDAENVTSAVGATGKNIVLLSDVTFSGTYLYYKNATVYGNGFTLDITDADHSDLKDSSDTSSNKSAYCNIWMVDSTLNNVRVTGSVYPEVGMTADSDYGNAVIRTEGECYIAESYISNCRVPLRVQGNTTVIDTVVDGGRYANIELRFGKLTLDGVTTINTVRKGSDGTTDVIGFGIVIHSEASNASISVIGDGLKQYNWVGENKHKTILSGDTNLSSAYKLIFNANNNDTIYFKYNNDRYVNTGILCLCADMNEDVVTGLDDRYYQEVSGYDAWVLTYNNSKHTSWFNESVGVETVAYIPEQYPVLPDYSGDETQTVEFTKGETYYFDTSVLNAEKFGNTLSVSSVTMNGTTYNYGDKIAITEGGVYDIVYAVVDPYNYNADASTTETVTHNVSVTVTAIAKDAEILAPKFTFIDQNGNKYESTTVKVGDKTYVMPNVTAADPTTNSMSSINIGSASISGTTVYFPVAKGYTVRSGSNFNRYYPLFNGINITDYTVAGDNTGTTYTTSGNYTSLVGSSGTKFIIPANGGQTNCGDYVKTNGQAGNAAGNSDSGWQGSGYNTSYGGTYLKSGNTNASRGADSNGYERIVWVEYCFNAGNGDVYYYRIGYHCNKESAQSCFTPDTLITLADGTQKRIDEVTYADQLLVWDFFKGEYTVVPGAIIFDHGYDNNTVIELMFSDGSSVKAVNLHQFFDADLNRFVDIDANSVADYVGHRFAKMAGNGYEMVTLVDYKITQEYCEAWGLISAEHYNIFVNGMLSTDFMYEDYALFNYFEVGEDMKFDEEKMQADIEKYGLYTYEDFDHVLTYEQFVAFNVQYFKIAVGKGEYTYEGILALIDTYLNN